MKTRYLVHYHESHVSAPVTGDGGRHIAYTKFMPDRGGQYCAELTRAEWDELRRVRWSSPLMECHGCLVPDVDYVATDGKVFTDEQACIAHETALTMAALDAESQLSQSQCGQLGVGDGQFEYSAIKFPMTIWAEGDQIRDVVDFFPRGTLVEFGDGDNMTRFDMLVVAACNAYLSKIFQRTPSNIAHVAILGFTTRPFSEALDVIASQFPATWTKGFTTGLRAKYEALGTSAADAVDRVLALTTPIIEYGGAGVITKLLAANTLQFLLSGAEDRLFAFLTYFRMQVVGSPDFSGLSNAAIATRIQFNVHDSSIIQNLNQSITQSHVSRIKAGSIPATATISTGDEMPPSLESRLITALASGKVHINTLVKDLGANREAIKEAVQASDFLVMDRACVALRKF